MKTEAKIDMNRQEAEELFMHLGEAMKTAVAMIMAIDRKKSWRDSEKAMAKVPYARRRDAFEKLRAKIGQAFDIGGY